MKEAFVVEEVVEKKGSSEDREEITRRQTFHLQHHSIITRKEVIKQQDMAEASACSPSSIIPTSVLPQQPQQHQQEPTVPSLSTNATTRTPIINIRKFVCPVKDLVKAVLSVVFTIIILAGCITYLVISIKWKDAECHFRAPRIIHVRHHQHTSFTSKGNVTSFQSFSFVQLFSPSPESLVSYATAISNNEFDVDLLDFQSPFKSYSSEESSKRKESQVCWQTIRQINTLNPLPSFVILNVPMKHPVWEESFYEKVIKGFYRLTEHIHFNITRVIVPGELQPPNAFTRDAVDAFVQKFGDDHYEFVLSGVKFIVSDSNYDYKTFTENGTRGVGDLKAEQESWISQSLEDSRRQPYKHVVIIRAGLPKFVADFPVPDDDPVRVATLRFLDDAAKYDRVSVITYEGINNRTSFPRLEANRQSQNTSLFTEREHNHPFIHRGLEREYKKIKRIFLSTEFDTKDFRLFHIYENDIEQQIFH